MLPLTGEDLPLAPLRRSLRALKPLRDLLLPLLRRPPMAGATPPAQTETDNRRPWEPPFDPSEPAVPISYPITTLQELESRAYFESFHYPFNRSSVPFAGGEEGGALPPRRRILVCHDMMGGYVDDLWVQGGSNPNAYSIWHWHLMDVFVYFSHYLVTLPPPAWTNAAHTHGVKVLGTFITEWEEGSNVCKTLLATKESARMYADRLTELATALGFDGWLINMESKLDLSQVDNLKEFIRHLSQTMHTSVPGSLVIWYDAVTKDGDLSWQNQLNEKNKPFFDLCDGIFVNYTWKENYPENSANVAGERRFDVYMGIDVFGRGTYGGGQWNTNVALDLLKKKDVSAAIFAPGWIYESEKDPQKPNFQIEQNRWWGLVEQSWGILQSYPKLLPFYSCFDQGHGYHFSIESLQVAEDPWNNISCQGFQPVLDDSADAVRATMQAFRNFKDASYSGGGNVTVNGTLRDNTFFSARLFHAQLPLGDLPLYISYSVKSDGNSLLGLCLELSSETDRTTILVANDGPPFSHVDFHYDEIICSQLKRTEMAVTTDTSWAIYEASIGMSGYILVGMYIICVIKRTDLLEPAREKYPKSVSNMEIPDGFSSYFASLGHISIRTSEQNLAFPPASSWVTKGEDISWATGASGAKTVSLKIVWELKTGNKASFVKYNIYVEKLVKQADEDVGSGNLSFLGVARVEAYYVSNLDVPTGVASLRFIIQVCGLDGNCQGLHESPAFVLAVES